MQLDPQTEKTLVLELRGKKRFAVGPYLITSKPLPALIKLIMRPVFVDMAYIIIVIIKRDKCQISP